MKLLFFMQSFVKLCCCLLKDIKVSGYVHLLLLSFFVGENTNNGGKQYGLDRFQIIPKSIHPSSDNYRWLAISKFKSVYFRSKRWLR